jgi:hypothetical protein
LWSNGYNSGGYTGGGQIAIEQNADESVSLLCTDDSFSTNDAATTGAGLLGGDVWTHVCCYRDGSNIKVAVNGVLEATAALTNAAGTLTNTNSGRTMNIASSFALAYGITDGELALFRVSAGSISSTQIRQIYEAEKGMFVTDAKVLLQSGSTDAVIDVDVDKLTGKVIATQTDKINIFDGLVNVSQPTVNSGASEKGKLWGDLRSEQNAANAYVTAPATDQRQVNEMVRGLANEMPKGVDLSKAKAWINQGSNTSTASIVSSYNIKSVTRTATGIYDVVFAVPFKSDTSGSGSAAQVGWAGTITGGSYNVASFDNSEECTRFTANIIMEGDDSTNRDSKFMAVFFGELENE